MATNYPTTRKVSPPLRIASGVDVSNVRLGPGEADEVHSASPLHIEAVLRGRHV